MLLPLLGVLVFAPIYWLLVPASARRDFLALASLAALGIYDLRLLAVTLALVFALFAATRAIAAASRNTGRLIAVLGFAILAALFVANKYAAEGGGVLPSQSGLVFLGMSYFALKAAAMLIESSRRAQEPPRLRDLAGWLVFLPTFPSGPMEEYRHFSRQTPRVERERILGGFERVLFGMVKALVISHYLGAWAGEIAAAPELHDPLVLLLATYAFSLHFYLDFAGYSDIAIGVAALYGYEIQENFDSPLIRRNLVQLWQRWHMTLTRWLRLYIFTPVSRGIMRRAGERGDTAGILAGQVCAMVFCGLWHGIGWHFALWGLLHALGLIWVGVAARRIGSRMPPALVGWWRKSPVAYALSVFITFNTFSLINIVALDTLDHSLTFYARLFGLV
ncbi:MAG: MBOAT family protein [Deltaproteobacteria bacterium]|nr:MBOAT family protein [Deltaproteobacteria bacterium]MBW2418601.1 MBOAT family protein [Deltaproteobacteria bacterium]